MRKKEVRAQLKEANTFEEKWKILELCPNKFGYKSLRNKILEEALELSNKLYQTEKIFQEKLTVTLERMILSKLVYQTEGKIKLKGIRLYSEKKFPGIYLQALEKREKQVEKNEDFNEAMEIAEELHSHPKQKNHILLLAAKLAKSKKQCLEIIELADEGYNAGKMAFKKMNRFR